jgi:hypothetical protein
VELGTFQRMKYPRARRLSEFSRELLGFFFLHRTATARQVQRAFSNRFGTERAVRMHLQTLARHGLLEALRGHARTGPNVYVMTAKGLQAIGEDTALGQVSRRRSTGSHFEHELLITELAVRLEAEARKRQIQIPWKERFELARHACFGTLIPDYGFLFIHSQGRQVCFVEASSGEESTTRLQQKLEAYAVWSETRESREFLTRLYLNSGAREPRATFRCLWIMHNRLPGGDDLRLRQLAYAASQLTAEQRSRVWCTTAASLFSAPLTPRWVRLSDLEGVLSQRPTNREWQRQVARRLASAARHGLFPTVEILR